MADAEPTSGAAAAAANAAPWRRRLALLVLMEENTRLETLVAAFEAGRASCRPARRSNVSQ